MAREMSDERKKFVDYMLEIRHQNELIETEERINEKVDKLKKELGEIENRAYEAAISEKVSEYQEKANAEGLTPEEIEAIKQERKEFEANPAAFGIVSEKCPIKDETDQKRALEIVELLKDTKRLGKVEEPDFMKMIEGYGERQKAKEPAWMKDRQETL